MTEVNDKVNKLAETHTAQATVFHIRIQSLEDSVEHLTQAIRNLSERMKRLEENKT